MLLDHFSTSDAGMRTIRGNFFFRFEVRTTVVWDVLPFRQNLLVVMSKYNSFLIYLRWNFINLYSFVVNHQYSKKKGTDCYSEEKLWP